MVSPAAMPNAPPEKGWMKNGVFRAGLLLFLLLLVSYVNSFDGDWHFDDYGNIVGNANLAVESLNWSTVRALLGGSPHQGNVARRPLAYFSFGLNHLWGGTRTCGYHLVNFVIHFLAAWVLYCFLRRVLRLPVLERRWAGHSGALALLAAALWASHPIHVSAVTYIVQRMTLLAALGYLGAMYAYLRARTASGSGGRLLWAAVCVSAGLGALASKENAAMLPLSLLFFDWFFLENRTLRGLGRSLRFCGAPLLVVAGLGLAMVDFDAVQRAYQARPFGLAERLLTEPRVLFFYLSLLAYPVSGRFTLLHDFTLSRSLLDPWTTSLALAGVLAGLVIPVLVRRRAPLIAYCVLFFFLNHLIEGTWLPLELVFEHRNYLPSSLLFVVPAAACLYARERFGRMRAVAVLILAAATVVLAAQGHTTYLRNRRFDSAPALLMDNLSKAPRLSRLHNNLGTYYWNRGHVAEALAAYRQALHLDRYSLRCERATTLENLGMCLVFTGDHRLALKHLRQAISVCRPGARTYYGMGLAYFALQRFSRAEESTKRALALAPHKPELHLLRSRIAFARQHWDEAIAAARRARRYDHRCDDALVALAESCKRRGDRRRAVVLWERYAGLHPEDVGAMLALIDLYAHLGAGEQASAAAAALVARTNAAELGKLLRRPEARGFRLQLPKAEEMAAVISTHARQAARDLGQGRGQPGPVAGPATP